MTLFRSWWNKVIADPRIRFKFKRERGIKTERERRRGDRERGMEGSAVNGRREQCQTESWSSGKCCNVWVERERERESERERWQTGSVQQRACSYMWQLERAATMLPSRIIMLCLFCCCTRRGDARHQAQRKCGNQTHPWAHHWMEKLDLHVC